MRAVDVLSTAIAIAIVRTLPLPLLAIAIVLLYVSWRALRPLCTSPMDLPIVLFDLFIALAVAVFRLAGRSDRPRFPEWTIALDVIQTIAHRMLDKYGETMVSTPENAQATRALADTLGKLKGRRECKQFNCHIEPVVVNGLEHLWVRGNHKETEDLTRYVVLFYHGGAYSVLAPALYIGFACRLRDAALKAHAELTDRRIEIDVFLANYRKTPEVAFPVPQQDAVTMFEYIRDTHHISPERIIVAGDSAGGGLTLSTLLRLRDEKQAAQPLAAILSYPWADLTDDRTPGRGEHCILARPFIKASSKTLFPNNQGPSAWKDASAVHCDLRGLAPAYIQVGTRDYLYQDSIKLMNKAKSDGVTNWQLDECINMPHIFTNLPPVVVPDSDPAIARLGEFVATQITAKSPSK